MAFSTTRALALCMRGGIFFHGDVSKVLAMADANGEWLLSLKRSQPHAVGISVAFDWILAFMLSSRKQNGDANRQPMSHELFLI